MELALTPITRVGNSKQALSFLFHWQPPSHSAREKMLRVNSIPVRSAKSCDRDGWTDNRYYGVSKSAIIGIVIQSQSVYPFRQVANVRSRQRSYYTCTCNTVAPGYLPGQPSKHTLTSFFPIYTIISVINKVLFMHLFLRWTVWYNQLWSEMRSTLLYG